MAEVTIYQQGDGAACAEGLTVIIDVFRAFTSACCMVERGVERIFPVADLNEAFAFKQAFPAYLLVGERKGIPLAGAEFGNSPAMIRQADLRNKYVIFSTSAGTQGFIRAVGADECISGSFYNAGAIVEYIKMRSPEKVSLVCMGHQNLRPSDEDTLCARYIRDALRGQPHSAASIRRTLSVSPDAARFFDPEHPWATEEDFKLCTRLDGCDVVLRYINDAPQPYLQPFRFGNAP